MRTPFIGITERGDAALDLDWQPWVRAGHPVILVTKAPSKLLPLVNPTDNLIVHCTITGWGGSRVEPGVFPWREEVKAYRALAERLGTERVVLRIDPVIPLRMGEALAKHVHAERVAGGRVRISFLDNYPHVRERFRGAGLTPLPYSFHAPLPDRLRIWRDLGQPEICGEPDMPCTGCVSPQDAATLGLVAESGVGRQRETCRCLAVKRELLSRRGQCEHGCLYCYWK